MKTSQVLAALGALSQGYRLAIYRLLVEHGPGGLTAGAIAQSLGLPPATLSFHLKELAAAGLVLSRQEGRYVRYRTDFDAMTGLIAYMTESCCRQGAACDAAPCVPAATTPPAARKRPASTRRR